MNKHRFAMFFQSGPHVEINSRDLPTEGQVQGNVALSDGGGQRSLKCDGVLLDGVEGLIGDGDLSVLEDGGDADGLPLDGDLNYSRESNDE